MVVLVCAFFAVMLILVALASVLRSQLR